MKPVNKILTSVLALFLMLSLGIVIKVVAGVELKGPLVIHRHTTKAELDSLKQEIHERGGTLKWTKVRFHEDGTLREIAGKASGYSSHLSFQTHNLDTVKIWMGAFRSKVQVDSREDEK